jgi:uncharacterized phage protein (TIGR02218 family)
MTRALPASIETMLEGTELTLARCVKINMINGDEFGFTDLDEDIELRIPEIDLTSSGTIYRAGTGLFTADIDLAVGLEADNTEISVPLGDVVTRAAVLGRRFNQTPVWIFDIDHSQDSPEPMELLAGRITEGRVEGGRAIFEIRGYSDMWNVSAGSVLTPRCRADYGDSKCGQDKVQLGFTVTAVESSLRFTIEFDDLATYADQYFRFGEVTWDFSWLYALPPMEVQQYGTAGVVELLEPAPQAPEVGDTGFICQGCSRLKKSDDPTIPTCFSHANYGPNGGLRFRGFDRVPGSDVYVRMPIPGQGGN